jgi:hypothetical protein
MSTSSHEEKRARKHQLVETLQLKGVKIELTKPRTALPPFLFSVLKKEQFS